MDKFLTFDEIIGVLDNPLIQNLSGVELLEGISIDTRKLPPHQIFVALRGENFDGHNFVVSACEQGAPFCIVERSWFDINVHSHYPLVVVENTLQALGDIANMYRSKFDIPIVAVGGSNGKTTTKDFVAHILSQKFNVLKTESNYNNQIGVPLTLFKLTSHHDVAVIEMGTNEPGEMFRLCEIVEPTDGIITNIGKEHLEKLIDLDGVEMEETTLFAYLIRHNGFAYVNLDDQRLERYVKVLDKYITYGRNPSAQIRADYHFDKYLFPAVNFEYGDLRFGAKLKNRGMAVAYASLPAVAVGLRFGLTPKEIVNGLETFTLDESKEYGRMLIKDVDGVTVINDTYNANPSSMGLALKTMEEINTNGEKYAVIGDMLELGESSLIEHRDMILLASKVNRFVCLFGQEMKKALNTINIKLDNVRFFETKDSILHFLNSKIKSGDIVLFKASRGIKMEEVVKKFIEK